MSQVKVTKIAETNVSPTILASHAARMCYTATAPKIGETIDVKKRLFDTGHHSTLEHNYWTFMIENIPVSSVVFGLHLTAPFYDTDQRSGRFSKMYDAPDMTEIRETLGQYYPGVSGDNLKRACDFIEHGLNIYTNNQARITEMAYDAIRSERPNAVDKYIAQNAPKFAQEQLRMFVSMIAPTALDWTVDLATICAFARTAWTPFMRDTMEQIANTIKTDHPDIAYMFDFEKHHDWNPKFAPEYRGIKTRPELKLLDYKYKDNLFHDVKSADTVDTLQFDPEYMDNSVNYVACRVHIDAGATMGQDQRHRAIKRSKPVFSGCFYLPPLLQRAGLKQDADKFMQEFYRLYALADIPRNMLMSIAPYGTMVQYDKHSELNATIHEQGKRTCWCAQEAIYHLACDLRRELSGHIGADAKLLKYMTPPCVSMGHCVEGARYCGRDLKSETLEKYFRSRQI